MKPISLLNAGNLVCYIHSYSYVAIEMPTTVEVDEKTLQMLNRVKKEMKAKSHDEVIKILIIERKKFPAPCLVQTAN